MKKLKKILAERVSRILDPVWEIPLALLLAIAFAADAGLRWRFLGVILFIDAIIPMIFFLTMLYHRQITDWDMQKRGERLPIYVFTLICHMGGLGIAHAAGKDELVAILLVYYLIGIVFVLVTRWWKISIHAGVNAVLITSLNVFYGWQYWWLYLILPLVMWARVYQKHHTWAQVVAGAVLGVGMTWAGLWLVD